MNIQPIRSTIFSLFLGLIAAFSSFAFSQGGAHASIDIPLSSGYEVNRHGFGTDPNWGILYFNVMPGWQGGIRGEARFEVPYASAWLEQDRIRSEYAVNSFMGP